MSIAPVQPRPVRHGDIESFRAMMRAGTTHKAAALLGCTQPAVSQAIRRLERDAGILLFGRRGNRLLPTPEAHVLMTEVDRSFVGMEAIAHRLAALRDFGVDRLEITSYPAFGLAFVPRALGRMQRAIPGARKGPGTPAREGLPQLSLQIASSREVRDAVARGTCDFGLLADEMPMDGINHSVFARMPGVVVMPRGHPLARRTVVQPRHLAETPFLALNPEDASRRRLEAVMRPQGVVPRIAANTPYAASICELAARGLGVGLVNPITALDYIGRGVTIRRFAVDVDFTCALAVPLDKPMSGAARAALTALRAQLADDRERLRNALA